jgi:hypothetical protein
LRGVNQKRWPERDDRSGEEACLRVEYFATEEVNADEDSEVVDEIQWLSGENVVAQDFSENREGD